jgi:hypothetical protein
MGMKRTACHGVALGLGAMLAGLVGCGPVQHAAITPPPPDLEDEAPVPGDAAEQVQAPAEHNSTHDQDGDGFVSPSEAEGYYRRQFGELDDDNDGRLSQAELEPETPVTSDLKAAWQDLVGATEQGYVDANLNRYNSRADPGSGMMSTSDFDAMVGAPDPMIGE